MILHKLKHRFFIPLFRVEGELKFLEKILQESAGVF